MSSFKKQLIFILLAGVIITAGALIIRGATPSGNLKINPILGHDLDLNALYYAQAGNNTVHDITTQDISISAWVKVDVDASDYRRIISKAGGNNIGYFMYFGANGNLRIYILDSSSNYYYLDNPAINLKDNKWHHVVGIIDRSDATQCKLFIDGISVSISKNGTLANVGDLTNSSNFSLGFPTVGGTLDGQIRDVKLYYAAGDHWSDAQVLYQAQHPFDYSANAGTLTDYWRLDEGTGTTLYGKVNNLTLSNVLAWTTQPKIKMVNQENTTTTSNNPVGWWKMDEGTGQYAYDSSGNGNTGTLGTSTSADGADPTWATGKLGKGLSFDGVNDYVNAGNVLNMGTSDFTSCAWALHVGSDANLQGVVSKYNPHSGNGTGWFLYFRSNRIIARVTKDDAEPKAIASVDVSITSTNNQWWHICMVRQGVLLSLYRNGVLIDSGSASTTVNVTLNSSSYPLDIGAGYTTGGYPYSGSIDDVRIYNRALSSSEVSQMYNSTKDGYLGNIKVSTGLVGYWKLDDASASSAQVTDYSGKLNHGTAYSGTATSTSVLSTSTAMVGRAMSFDGSNDYITIPKSSSWVFNQNPFTISVWVNQSSIQTGSYFIGNYPHAGLNGVFFLGTYPSSPYNIYFSGNDSIGTAGIINFGVPLLRDQWVNLVMTRTGTKTMTIYVNGVLVGSGAPVGNGNYDWAGYSTFNLGFASGGNYFNGLIDEVKIYNYARTAEQIKQDYERGLRNLP